MKKWSEQSSDFLDALGGSATNPLINTPDAAAPVVREVHATSVSPTAEKRITSINVNPATYQEFKKYAVDHNSTVSQLLESAMLDMLGGSYLPGEQK